MMNKTLIFFSKAHHNGHFGYFSSVNLSVSQVLQERSDGVESIAAFDSYSASGYVIRCNQRERRTSRSHQHLHIALLLELEQIHRALLIHHFSAVRVYGHKRRCDRQVVGGSFTFIGTRWAGGLFGPRFCLCLRAWRSPQVAW